MRIFLFFLFFLFLTGCASQKENIMTTAEASYEVASAVGTSIVVAPEAARLREHAIDVGDTDVADIADFGLSAIRSMNERMAKEAGGLNKKNN
jgi:beta-lactamase superfamily II metal-dependent hydrolase